MVTWVCTEWGIHIYVHMCRGQKTTLGVTCPAQFLLPISPQLVTQTRMSIVSSEPWGSAHLCLFSTGLQVCAIVVTFFLNVYSED